MRQRDLPTGPLAGGRLLLPSLNTQPTHRPTRDDDLGRLYRAHLHTLEERLERALESAGADGVVIFSGHAPMPARDDQAYPFRPEPFFVQWCPLTGVPGAALVLAPGQKPRLLHPRSRDFWHAPPEPPSGFWRDCFDVELFESTEELDWALRRVARGFRAIGDAPDARDRIELGNSDALIRALEFERAVKTDYEIECIGRANDMAAAGHRAVAHAFGADACEFDLNLLYLETTRQRDDELPYPSIVAVNEHASVLHYQRLERTPPAEARLLLVDAGARFAGFAADVTRTSIRTDSGMGELLESMETMQQTLCGRVASGADFVELNDEAHRLLAGVLHAHGLVSCSADEAYDTGVTRLFLPHGLGHLLGLQVHDAGGWQQTPEGDERRPPDEHPYLRLTRLLEPGFVVTIEPGLYFIDALLEGAAPAERRRLNSTAVDRLRPFGGIRIEDDVVAKAGDNLNLTRAAFAAIGAQGE